MKYNYYVILTIIYGCGILKNTNTTNSPITITQFKTYIDSLIIFKTDKSFILNKTGLKEYKMIDTTERLNVCIDTMCFDWFKEYKYTIRQHKKDELVQNLLDELKNKSEINTEYYLLVAEKKYSCYFNEVKSEMVCPEFISNFTFYNKNLFPIAKYYWWRGSLRSKDVYFYQNGRIKDTLMVNL